MARWGGAFALRHLLGSGAAFSQRISGGRWYHHGGRQYEVKVGIAEFLRGIGRGVEGHVEKVEAEVGGDIQRLLETRTLRLKKLGIPCKHRKLILNYAHKYRLGLWRPRAEPLKA